MSRKPNPENQAVFDRIPVVLVAWKLGQFGVVEEKVLARRPTPFGRVGLTGDEIAVLTGGDLNSQGKSTGWDLGQRCYRRLRQMIDDGLVDRTPPGGSPVFYWPTQKLLDQHQAALAALPPLTTQESP